MPIRREFEFRSASLSRCDVELPATLSLESIDEGGALDIFEQDDDSFREAADPDIGSNNHLFKNWEDDHNRNEWIIT